jgi:hypothetical protein
MGEPITRDEAIDWLEIIVGQFAYRKTITAMGMAIAALKREPELEEACKLALDVLGAETLDSENLNAEQAIRFHVVLYLTAVLGKDEQPQEQPSDETR